MGQGPSTARRVPFEEAEGPWQGPNATTEQEAAQAGGSAPAPATPSTAASGFTFAPVTGATAGAAAISGTTTSNQAAPAAMAAPAPAAAAAAPAAAPARPAVTHKSTAIIPGWSRHLTSQTLTIECQKITQSNRGAGPRDCYGVMELEVMKFVAYCGGLTIKLRVDDLQHGPVESVTWGLGALRACPALANANINVTAAANSPTRATAGNRNGSSSPLPGASGSSGNSSFGPNKANPVSAISVDNPSRKPLYSICATACVTRPAKGDILSMDLSPKEDGQPVIMVTLAHNGMMLLRAALPCASIAALQMYPFITVMPGMVVSLHEALTPSPLFTWYSPTSATADITMADLDTCVKYNTAAAASATGVSEFHGSTAFTGGRHRWTVQLDNLAAQPGHIFVGLVHAEQTQAPSSSILAASLPQALAGRALGAAAQQLQSAAGASPAAAAGAAATSSSGAVQLLAPAGSVPAHAAAGSVGGAGGAAAAGAQRGKWGVWVKLPGSGGNAAAANSATPPADGITQSVESTSNHCCITVDLDLIGGYAKFFRNGHLLGTAFTGLTSPISPALGFLQGANQHLQAGLVNITKLQQLDLDWNAEACSGDLRINGRMVQKVSEVFGDYSTVLANKGFISGVHLWLVKVNHLSEPDSIFIGVCRGCMPLDQDPQDLRDRTYYLSNGVIRVGGRRVATNSANFTKGDIVGVVLDADQGEIVFLRNGIEQGRARGIRGRLYPFVSMDSELDQITLLGSYSLPLNRTPRTLADMEWDTVGRGADIELSSNCLTATKSSGTAISTVRGTILYADLGCHEFHVILDSLGPDGIWVGVASPEMDASKCVGDAGCGWALHSDGDRRFGGREEEFTSAFSNGDVLTVGIDLANGILRFSRNGVHLGDAFHSVTGPLVAAVTLASEESKVTIQNRPTVLNMGEYTGELRWDEVRAGRDLHVIDGLTVTKMSNEGGDYATVLGTLCVASGQHSWNVYVNHVEDSNLFIGATIGGHDLNADPQEMKSRTYYLSNGTIRVAGKLVTRCAEPYAEGDLVTVQLDMDAASRHIAFYKNGVLQGAGDGLPEELWPYVSLDNIMDSITLHSSSMFLDLAQSLKWNALKASPWVSISADGIGAALKPAAALDSFLGQATVLGMREYSKMEVHSWVVRLEQQPADCPPTNFLVGVAPAGMDLSHSIGQEGCGIGLDYYGYIYVNGKYFHVSNLSNWQAVAKPCRGSTARHKGKAGPMFQFLEGRCEITLTLDLKEGTLRFSSGGHSIGTIANVRGPLHAALTLTGPGQTAMLAPGPIGKMEHTAEELVNILKAKGHLTNARAEAAMLLVPRDVFVPRDRHREAFRDQKVTVRMPDGSTLTMPPPSVVATALEALDLAPGRTFLDVGCGSGYVTAVAAVMVGPTGMVHGIECVSSRLEAARANMRRLKERLPSSKLHLVGASLPVAAAASTATDALAAATLSLGNVLIPECTDGLLYDALYCDTSVGEEDLPAFLSLLRPKGRMVVVIEEELLLLTRSGADPHDIQRASLTRVSGDFGELEDPTPWEVQEAIARIKQREHKKGLEQAKGEAGNLRSFELQELQQRMVGAMARIAELEATLQRGGGGGGGSAGASRGAQQGAAARDAKPHRRSQRMSPRNGARSPIGGVGEHQAVRLRSSRAQVLEDGEEPMMISKGAVGANNGSSSWAAAEKLAAAASGDAMGSGSGGKIGTAVYGSGGSGSSGAGLLAAMGVQTLSVAQVAALVRCVAQQQVGMYKVYQSSYKGTPCHVWRLTLSQPVNMLELQRACSRFCCAHPNVAAIFGICVEPIHAPQPMDEDGAGIDGSSSPVGPLSGMPEDAVLEEGCHLWVVEERHGDTSLAARLERGLLSWQHVFSIAADVGSALAYLQTLHRLAPGAGLDEGGCGDSPALSTPLSPLAVAHMLVPATVHVAAASAIAKLSLVPAMLVQLEFSLGFASGDMQLIAGKELLLPYFHSNQMFGDGSVGKRPSGGGAGHVVAFNPLYGYAVLLLQLLTEQQAPGLLGTVRQALSSGTLFNLVPRVPAGQETVALAEDLARLALRCAESVVSSGSSSETAASSRGAAAAVAAPVVALDGDVLAALNGFREQLAALGAAAVSWESVEELLLVPLAAPGAALDPTARRWVRQDFRCRRRLFMEEAAKLAAEGPIHKIEVRRSRCFKDSVTTFSGKGQNVWRQPLKVTFIGEAGMDSGGVTREWFSCICSALSRGSLDLFWAGGPMANQLYVNPLSNSPSHLKRFHFVGMFMAKALLESAARAKEVGPISLNLRFCEPFWKLLLGIPVSLMDLQALDPTEFRSLLQILQLDIEGLIFEAFSWNFQHMRRGGSGKDEPEVPALPSGASPFSGDNSTRVEASIPLKPGGVHVKVTNANKREYVLLKAQKMLMGAVEAQMSAIIDAFHSLVPRELIEKYAFTPLELQLLVCGEQVINVAELRAACKYEDGYTGKEDQITWFWAAVDGFDDVQRRQLLQFWSGSDGMPVEGFAALEPAFHIVSVDRMYDKGDRTARLPAAHTCFRQLDLPRYNSYAELREKVLTAITMGQGYMALS